jgi:GBP family porin
VKRLSLTISSLGFLVVSTAHAQSSVTLYGLLDAGVMYTNNVASGSVHSSLWQTTSGNINGNRVGLRGAEDLGAGLKAVFELENGFNVQDGKLSQDNRLFGRQAYVGLSDEDFGTMTLGRQYDSVVDFLQPLSAIATTYGDAGFAHPFDNDNLAHSVRINNAVKYTSDPYSGLKLGGLYAFSNSTNFAADRAYSFGANYANGPWDMAAAYLQIDGSAGSSANSAGAVDVDESASNGKGGFELGAAVQRSYGSGMNYAIGPATLGFVYTHSLYEGSMSFGSQGGNVSFNNYEVNGKYAVTPALRFGLAFTYTDGHVEKTTSYGTDPSWRSVDFQTVYMLSKRVDAYFEAMFQHASGQNYVAVLNTSGGVSSTANQVVATVGMRARF